MVIRLKYLELVKPSLNGVSQRSQIQYRTSIDSMLSRRRADRATARDRRGSCQRCRLAATLAMGSQER